MGNTLWRLMMENACAVSGLPSQEHQRDFEFFEFLTTGLSKKPRYGTSRKQEGIADYQRAVFEICKQHPFLPPTQSRCCRIQSVFSIRRASIIATSTIRMS